MNTYIHTNIFMYICPHKYIYLLGFLYMYVNMCKLTYGFMHVGIEHNISIM